MGAWLATRPTRFHIVARAAGKAAQPSWCPRTETRVGYCSHHQGRRSAIAHGPGKRHFSDGEVKHDGVLESEAVSGRPAPLWSGGEFGGDGSGSGTPTTGCALVRSGSLPRPSSRRKFAGATS